MSGGLIGSRISLISRKDIRWEGILVEVDREKASVTLQNVRSWGTEHRTPGEAGIAGSPTLHERVSFRGEDIKDLHVHETAEPTPPPPPPAAPTMPPPSMPIAHPTPGSVAPDAAGGGHPSAPMRHPQYPQHPQLQQHSQLPQHPQVPQHSQVSQHHPQHPQHPQPPQQQQPQQQPQQQQQQQQGQQAQHPQQQSQQRPTPSVQPPSIPSNGGVGTGEKRTEQDPGADSPPMMPDQGRKPGRYQPPHKNPNWKPPPTVNRPPPGPVGGSAAGAGALPGQGNHLLNRRTRGAGGGPTLEEGEFDFQAGLARFDKEKEMALLASGISTVSVHDKTKSTNGGANVDGGGVDGGRTSGTFSGENGHAGAAGEASGSTAPGKEDASDSQASPEAGAGSAEVSGTAKGAGDVSEGHGTTQTGTAAGTATAERMGAAEGGGMWVEAPVAVKKYNKSSFFDEISCDALDTRNRVPRGRGAERTRNTETFGATSVALAAGSRRYGGRNSGYGGYGGYSGGGRRGYHNDDYLQGGGGDYGSRGRSYGDGGGGDRQESSGSWRRT